MRNCKDCGKPYKPTGKAGTNWDILPQSTTLEHLPADVAAAL